MDDYKAPGPDLNAFPDGVYYISWNGDGNPCAVRFCSYGQKKSIDVVPYPAPFELPRGLGVAPDLRHLVYELLSGTGTDLTLIEFR